jgi:hypothetical protein
LPQYGQGTVGIFPFRSFFDVFFFVRIDEFDEFSIELLFLWFLLPTLLPMLLQQLVVVLLSSSLLLLRVLLS